MKAANIQTLSSADLNGVAGGSLGAWLWTVLNPSENAKVEAAAGSSTDQKQGNTHSNISNLGL